MMGHEEENIVTETTYEYVEGFDDMKIPECEEYEEGHIAAGEVDIFDVEKFIQIRI
jgi:hypothetical protein